MQENLDELEDKQETAIEGDDEDQSGLYEHYRFTVDKGQSLLRIDKFLGGRIENISRSRVQTAAEAGCIVVNGKAVKSSYKVKPGDIISIVMPYERRETEIIPENIPLSIVYEDDDVMVVDKPAGLVVHPGHGNYSGTLVNAVAYHLDQQGGTYDKDDVRGGLLVHRIDKDTSGLLVIAKNPLAHSRLSKQFFDHSVIRRYAALVWGVFDEPEGTITGNIGRNVKDKLKMAVFPSGDAGKHAVTHYKVLSEIGYVSLLECRLETGRTHQIRVHLEYLSHPLFNDARYGGNRILRGTTFTKYKQFVENCFTILPRQALHAKVLGFVHPSTGEDMLFESPLPKEMEAVVNKWTGYMTGRAVLEETE